MQQLTSAATSVARTILAMFPSYCHDHPSYGEYLQYTIEGLTAGTVYYVRAGCEQYGHRLSDAIVTNTPAGVEDGGAT